MKLVQTEAVPPRPAAPLPNPRSERLAEALRHDPEMQRVLQSGVDHESATAAITALYHWSRARLGNPCDMTLVVTLAEPVFVSAVAEFFRYTGG